MTFHFAHMAPPGANARTPARGALAVCRVRCPFTHRLVMHRDRFGDDPTIPAQHAPVPADRPLTGSRAA